MRTPSILLCLWLVACSGDDTALPPDGGAVRALFEIPGQGGSSGFYALPYPNDMRLSGAGIDLADHPRPNPLLDEYIEAMSTRLNGFGLSPVVFFRFTGTIDTEALPSEAAASLLDDSSVYLVNVDPSSAAKGARTPVRVRFHALDGSVIGRNWLAVQAVPGFVLEEATTYAVVVTRDLNASGVPVERDEGFEQVMSELGGAGAQEAYAPLLSWLDEPGGEEREGVLSAAVFTTQVVSGLLESARTVIYRDTATPTPRQVSKRTEDGTMAVYEGLFDAPNFQTGDVPYQTANDGGEIVTSNGEPTIARMEELRFALSVPVGDPPVGGWPLVLYSHGTGGSYLSFVNGGSAARFAAEGMAVLSMDQVLHPPRVPEGTSPEVAYFNLLNPLAARDNNLQGAIDLFNLTRFAVAFSYTDGDAARTIEFDDEALSFFGHSQGGLTGTPFLAVEPLVQGAVLSGAGGLLYLSLLYKTEPLDIPSLVSAIIRDNPVDEFNPVLALLQAYLDRSDPISYARRVTAGVNAKSIFQGEGFTDTFTPNPSIEALALALDLDMVTPLIEEIANFELAGKEVLSPPISGNLGEQTGVLLQYQAPAARDGHFVLFDVQAARQQSIGFLRSLALSGTATLN